jgi:S-formylglutathione hydrolase FrmB
VISLTGLPLQVTVVVVAIAAIVGAVWLVPRVAGRGAAHVLARIALVFGCQLCLVVAALDLVNASFDFYASWGDLVGTGHAANVASDPPASGADTPAGPATPGAPAGPAGPVSRIAAVTPDPAAPHYRLPAGQGRIDSVVIHGTRTLLHAPGFVYLPPQYFDPRFRTRRFPVIVALTGYPGNAQNLVTHLKLPQTAAGEMAAGRMPPAIIVMVRPTVAPPRDTECTDVPHGPQVETFFAEDVPTALGSVYRTADQAAGWSAMGDSTGGYCAIKLAMRHSDRYAVAVSLAGYYHALRDFTTGDLYGRSTAYRRENDLLWRLRHRRPPPVDLLLTTSRVGEKDYRQTLRFLSLARPPTRVASITLPFGGHNFSTWQKELPPALNWLGAHLEAGT